MNIMEIQRTSLKFDDLPDAIFEVLVRLALIEDQLNQLLDKPNEDRVLTITEAAEFVHLSVPTLYGKCHSKDIPYSKKGKRLYFSKQELTSWMKSGNDK